MRAIFAVETENYDLSTIPESDRGKSVHAVGVYYMATLLETFPCGDGATVEPIAELFNRYLDVKSMTVGECENCEKVTLSIEADFFAIMRSSDDRAEIEGVEWDSNAERVRTFVDEHDHIPSPTSDDLHE